ncbi:unnamed protein product [Periconia digitata]|uniref:Peptidase M13 N-terminal domain-containing protein n=1 Tax=Periconia digitata TaxID=1303443 RepID=A0A9W4U4B4_9PLEO|nr:unnamed protein product [Periconia digitata]
MKFKSTVFQLILATPGLCVFPFLEKLTTGKDVCLTPECIEAASRILSNLHPDHKSIDPCNSFDQYVCGGYHTQYPTDDDMRVLEYLGYENKYLLKSILDRPYPNNSDSSDDKPSFDMMVTNYQSCMNQKTRDNSSMVDIGNMVSELTKLFPVTDEECTTNKTIEDKDQDSLAKAIAFLTKKGVPFLGEFGVLPDNQNPDIMIPTFTFSSNISSSRAVPSMMTMGQIAELTEETLGNILTIISPKGWETRVASLAREVLKLLDRGSPSHVTLDIHMGIHLARITPFTYQ